MLYQCLIGFSSSSWHWYFFTCLVLACVLQAFLWFLLNAWKCITSCSYVIAATSVLVQSQLSWFIFLCWVWFVLICTLNLKTQHYSTAANHIGFPIIQAGCFHAFSRFKDYIEQRQKQQAKYHHPTSLDGTPDVSTQGPSMVTVSLSESPEDVFSKGLLTTASQAVVGPSPAQVQKMNTEPRQGRPDLPGVLTNQSRSVASSKAEVPAPLPSPLLRKHSEAKSSLALSDLLSAPTTELKAAANKISETLKVW